MPDEPVKDPVNSEAGSSNESLKAGDTVPVPPDKEPEHMEVHHHAHSHVKRNWKSYFWEFLMLFLAVFCGFLAEYQLEHVIERQREKQYMQSFLYDLINDTTTSARDSPSKTNGSMQLTPSFTFSKHNRVLQKYREMFTVTCKEQPGTGAISGTALRLTSSGTQAVCG